jgi:hypothetical protein
MYEGKARSTADTLGTTDGDGETHAIEVSCIPPDRVGGWT